MLRDKLKVGDYVFAKVKGFPEWPAKIYAVINKKYYVYYYGTYETGVVKEKALFKFPDCRELLVTESKLKKAKFRAAVQEIDAALAGDDLAPADLLTWAAKAMGADVENTPIITRIQIKPEFPLTSATTIKQAPQPDSAGEVNVDNLAAPTSGKAAKRKGRKPKGPRKLKYATATPGRKPTAAVYPSFKRKITKWNNILLCYVYPNTLLAIKKNHRKPDSFDSLKEECEWQFKAASEAQILKNALESGLVNAHAVLDRVILNPPKKRIPKEVIMRFHADALEKDLFLKSERMLCMLCDEIRESLRLEEADVDRALESLMHVREQRLSLVMLLRNPYCVEVICRLCLYEGNLEEWNLDPNEEFTFKCKARLIREEAYALYLKFRAIFRFKDSRPFYERFLKHVSVYKELTRSCLPEQKWALTDVTYRHYAAIIMRARKAEKLNGASMAQDVEMRDGEEIVEFKERVGEQIVKCENEDTVEYGQDNEWEPADSDEEKENRTDSQVADAKKTNFIIT